MKRWLWGYGAALLVMAVLDGIWLGFVSPDFYKAHMAEVMAAQVNWLPAVLFYLGYPAAVIALALSPAPATMAWGTVLWRSALTGLLAYATYDLTNWATLRGWDGTLVLVDLLWGTVLTAAAGAAAHVAMRKANRAKR